MGPAELKTIAAFVGLAQKLSGWPFGLMVFLFILGPWLLAMILSYMQNKRFEAVVKMYESNVKLVESYESLAKDLKDVVIMNTQTNTRLVDRIDAM